MKHQCIYQKLYHTEKLNASSSLKCRLQPIKGTNKTQMREGLLINCSVANYTDGVDPADSTKGTEIKLIYLH